MQTIDSYNNYHAENEYSPLFDFMIAGTELVEFGCIRIGIRSLNKLSRCCKAFYVQLLGTLDRLKKQRQKYVYRFANKLPGYLMQRAYPLKFVDKIYKKIHVEEMGYNSNGLCIMDVDPLFTADDHEKINDRLVAFANVKLRARDPIDCLILVMFRNANANLLNYELNHDSWIDTGEITPQVAAHYREQYGNNTDQWPGRYVIDLKMPLRFNPILMGTHVNNLKGLGLCITQDHSYDNETNDINDNFIARFDPVFVIDNFTHAIIEFKIASATENDEELYNDYVMKIDTRPNIGLVLTPTLQKKK